MVAKRHPLLYVTRTNETGKRCRVCRVCCTITSCISFMTYICPRSSRAVNKYFKQILMVAYMRYSSSISLSLSPLILSSFIVFNKLSSQIKKEECGRKSDIWALGGCCLYMATGDFPWRFATGFEKAGKMNSFAFFFKVMDSPDATPLTGLPTDKLNMINQVGCEPMLPFLARCFERLPANRAKAVDLLQHPWLRR
jgi:serine/threonine protein kinase